MKRVLHITRSVGRGGIGTFLMNVYKNIDRSQVQFDFLITMENPEYGSEIEQCGGKIYTMPSRREAGFAGYRKLLDNFFAEHAAEYDAVHCHISSLSSIEPLKYARKYNIPIRISHGHNTNQRGFMHHVLHHIHKCSIGKSANKFVGCSVPALDWLYSGTAVRKKAMVIPNGMDLKKFRYSPEIRRQYREKLGIADNCLVLGHVGRFNPVKNHKFLVDVFFKYFDKYGDSKLLLLGDGSLKNEIEIYVDKLGIADKVIFAGSTPEVPHLLQAMDVFVFPSFYEGMPLTMIEAQAAGLPILCSEAIPEEAKITGNIWSLPLDKGVEHWAGKIHDITDTFNREDVYESISNSPYDINSVIELLYSKVYEFDTK